MAGKALAQSTPAQTITDTAGISIRPTNATTGWTTTNYPANTGPMLIRAINNATHGKDSTLQFWNKEGNIDFLLRIPTGQPTAQGIFSVAKSTSTNPVSILTITPGTTTDKITLAAETTISGAAIVNSTATFNAATTINAPLTVSGNVSMGGNLTLGGSAVLNTAQLNNWLPLEVGGSYDAMIWGPNATGTGTFTVSIGNGSISNSSISIGNSAVSGAGVTASSLTDVATRALYQPSTWTGGAQGIALGDKTFASNHAVAIGSLAAARTTSVAAGYHAQAYGTQSIALGLYSLARGESSIAIGPSAYATDTGSIALGFSQSRGYGSFAGGAAEYYDESGARSPESEGRGSFSYGLGHVRAAADFSFAFGTSTDANYGTDAFGKHSFAFGKDVYTTADHGFSFGRNLNNSGVHGVSMGSESSQAGAYAFGQGTGLSSYDAHTLVFGRFNQDVAPSVPGGTRSTDWISDTALFVLANGSSTSARSNAFVVRKNGDTDVNGKIKVQGDAELSGDTTTVSGVLILTEPAGGIAVAEEFDDTP